MTRDPLELLRGLVIPDPVAITEGDTASGLGLGELATALEAAGIESLDALANPGRLTAVQQLRLRQALLWVRVRRLRHDPDPDIRALAETPFADTDAWLPVLPASSRNGDGPANPSIPAEPPRGSRSRRKS